MNAAACTTAITLAFFASAALSQEKSSRAPRPEVRKVVLENDRVRVSESADRPGDATPARAHLARVTRALRAASIERTFPDGRKDVLYWKVGESRWFPAQTYAARNVGPTDSHFHTVELKR